MGRSLRIQDPSLHYHVIVRCNNEAFHFDTDDDFRIYLQILRRFKQKHRFRLFNYELMNSHIHLLLQPSDSVLLEKTMFLINGLFARHYNQRKKRKGHFWLDRYKAIPVETDQYALNLMRYINRNTIRAGIAREPGEWRWSGYRFYALGEENDLLDPHPTFLGLSEKPEIRKKAFVNYVAMSLPGDDQRRPEYSEAKFIGSESFGRKLGLSTGYF